MFLHWQGSFIKSTIHAFFTLTKVELDKEEISKSTNIELKVSSFDKTLQRDIYSDFPCKLSFCDMSDVTDVESDSLSNNALVVVDFDPIKQ